MNTRSKKAVSSRPISTITLPRERVLQLREASKKHNLTMSELIGRYVAMEIEAGIIPNQIPGFSVRRAGTEVEFGFGNSPSLTLTPGEARRVAECIERAARDNARDFAQLKSGKTFFAQRAGRGVIIQYHETFQKPLARRSLTPDIARDLAHMLRTTSPK
jgi:hypothetical protein